MCSIYVKSIKFHVTVMEGVKVSDNLQVVDDIAGSFDGDNSRSKGMIVCSDVDFSSDSWTDDADSVIG